MLVMLSAIFLATGPSAGQDKKDDKEILNPYRTAKVGDFAIYKLVRKGKESTVKKTVSAKDEKSVKLNVSDSNGPEREVTIDLTKPLARIPVPDSKWATFKKTGEGKEKIKVAGKEYDANWISGKMTTEFPKGGEVALELKTWFSKDAPLDGVLRFKTGSVITMELIESGSAK
jgi:hypothetical protein